MTDISAPSNNQTAPLRLWLVRHGTTIWNAEGRFCGESDPPLSPLGLQQAHWLSQQFRSTNIAAIYSSDLKRAQQTAEHIAGQRFSVHSTALWRELAFGRWEGLTYAEIIALPENDFGFFTNPLHSPPPSGESLLDLSLRVQQGLRLLLAAFHSLILSETLARDFILVSHAGPLRVLLCQLLHVPLEYQWQFQLAPGSLSALDLSLMPDEETFFASLALLNMQMPASEKEMPTERGPL